MKKLDLSLSATALRLAELQSDIVAESMELGIMAVLEDLGMEYAAEGRKMLGTAIDRLEMKRVVATVLEINWSEELRAHFVAFYETELGEEYLRTQPEIAQDVQRATQRMGAEFVKKVVRNIHRKEE